MGCCTSCGCGGSKIAFILLAATTAGTIGFVASPDKKDDAKATKAAAPAEKAGADKKDGEKAVTTEPTSFHDFTVKTIDGESKSLKDYAGKVCLVVNTASQCGYTPQYKELEAVYKKYQDQGFVVLGFPSNDFGGQEPGSSTEIKSFCEKNYSVTFPLFEKVAVKGMNAAPLYQWLSKQKAGGPMTPGWNFSKYIVDQKGQVVSGFASGVKPDDAKITGKVEELLKNSEKATPATKDAAAPATKDAAKPAEKK